MVHVDLRSETRSAPMGNAAQLPGIVVPRRNIARIPAVNTSSERATPTTHLPERVHPTIPDLYSGKSRMTMTFTIVWKTMLLP